MFWFTKYPPFPLSIKEIKKSLDGEMYKYPYTEGDDNIKKVLLDCVEREGFINIAPLVFMKIWVEEI